MKPKKTKAGEKGLGPLTGRKGTPAPQVKNAAASAKAKKGQQQKRAAGKTHRAAARSVSQSLSFPVVGMGASAGGLEAFEAFFSHTPADSDIAFVLVPHLDPSHKSMMTELLRRFTSMEVVEAQDGMRVQPNYVHVIPPDKDMALEGGVLRLSQPEERRGLRMPIDFFFRSLAEDQKDKAVCIILSGNGTDGTMGLKAIHEAGGMSMVEDPQEARYDGMPRSAINTGLADYVLPVEKMPQQLLAYAKRMAPTKLTRMATISERAPKVIERILNLLRTQTGHDFSYYKKSTTLRRIDRRMTLHELEDAPAYLRYLQEHPEEVHMLFKELLISVTSFFRDLPAFEVLKEKVLPILLEGKPDEFSLRVWVPGAATGEEAYSIAMIIREYLDEHKLGTRFQIFGTDIDEEAVNTARAGIYPGNIAIDVNPERLRRFFIRDESTYRIKKEIRETVIFALQNVIADAPFTRLDLVSCRNLLIYLESELQNKLIPLFHYALKPDGILFLGSSESIGPFADLFRTVDRKWKFFQRKEPTLAPQTAIVTRLPWTYEHAVRETGLEVRKRREVTVGEVTQKLLLENFTPPCVIVNEKGDVLYVHGRTGRYLEPAPGHANLNVLEMAREGITYELRSSLQNAVAQHKEIVCRDLRVKTNGEFQPINLMVRPIEEPEALKGLLMVIFEEIRPKHEEQAGEKKKALGKQSRRVQELEQELRYSKESLQATIEELQASNEELKSTNEELQSTNEELQSTNEELETSKEEIQSVNEELVTVNSELQAKIDQLSRAENDMRNLLDSTNIGTIFLDSDLRIKRFTLEATKVVNLIPTDVGRPIGHIVTNLQYDNLVQDVETVLQMLTFKEVQVQTKDGNWYVMRIMPYRTVDNVIDGVVITFIDINAMRRSAEVLNRELMGAQALTDAKVIAESLREPVLLLNAEKRVIGASPSFLTLFDLRREETEGRPIFEIAQRGWDAGAIRKILYETLPRQREITGFKLTEERPDGRKRQILMNARLVGPGDGGPDITLLTFDDVTRAEKEGGKASG